MKETNQNKKRQTGEFNPKIIVGIIGSSDLDTLKSLKDFFSKLDGFSLIYLTTSGSHLYITDKKPEHEHDAEGD